MGNLIRTYGDGDDWEYEVPNILVSWSPALGFLLHRFVVFVVAEVWRVDGL